MDNNTKDNTLKKNYIHKYQFLIKEYESVKSKNFWVLDQAIFA